MLKSESSSPQLFDLSPGPNFSIEQKLLDRGCKIVAGTDEAGRGPLAGPVVAAAVVLDPTNIPIGLNDSKKLAAKTRGALLREIVKTSHVAWAAVGPATIDDINILQASLLAMARAVKALEVSANHVLVDGRHTPADLPCTTTSLIKGDARSLSIAAASIVAKCARDQIMAAAGQHWPEYGFERHKGYGTADHLKALATHGPCSAHRQSFAPVRNAKISSTAISTRPDCS